MISILLTSFKEPNTIGLAIKSLTSQGIQDYELLVAAPDEDTLNAAREKAVKNKKIKVIQDPGKGKPTALNMLFKHAKGDILVLSDGDVLVDRNAIKNLIKPFSDKSIGAASGQVVSSNPQNSALGFWAHVLSTGFDIFRKSESENVICSGYLYAIRRGIVKSIPSDTLADDAYISLYILSKGFKSVYVPQARVFVKYPTNLPDWISQKKRTAGRLYQLSEKFKLKKSSSLKSEIISGFYSMHEINSPRELLWFIGLVFMRIYIWARIFLDFRLKKRAFSAVWQRVESTK